MSLNEEKLKSIKSEIRSLLISCPVGLNLGRFLKDYHECLGNNLPFRDFGYKTAWDFLLSMPDVVKVKETSEGKLLVPVENKLISHIHQLVTKQRKQKDRHRSGRSRRKSAYVNFKHSYFTIERKKKSRKTRKESSYNMEDDVSSFISDFDELCLIRSDHVSTTQTMKYQTKGFSKNLKAEQSTNSSLSNFSSVSLNSSLKLKSDLPKHIGKIPIAETERFDNVQRHLDLESEDEDYSSSDEIQVSYRLKNARCYSFSSDTDESALSESLPEFLPSNDEISDIAEGEDGFNVESFAPKEEEYSADMSSIYVKDYSPLQALPKNCSCDEEDEISYQLQRFHSCDVLAEGRELRNEKFSQMDSLELQMVISDEHDHFLCALANGIILDPDKVLEPYKDQLKENEKREENSNCSNYSNSDTIFHVNSSANSNNFKIFLEFISSRNKIKEQTNYSQDDTSVRSSNDKTDFQSSNNNSRIIKEFKKMICLRNRQNSNKLSESSISDKLDIINTISDCSDPESITRNIGRGSVLKKIYDVYQARISTNNNKDSIATNGNGRGQFLKKLVERTRHSHL